MYVTASIFTDEKQKRAIFLKKTGGCIPNISETLTDTGDTYMNAKERVISYFKPIPYNQSFGCSIFRRSRQEDD